MKRRKWRRRTSSRRMRTRSKLQCSLPWPCSRVVLVGQGNCFFPVNEEGEKQEKEEEEVEEENKNEEEVEEEKEEEEVEEDEEHEEDITTTMPSSATMQQSCTRGSRHCFFPVHKGWGRRRRRRKRKWKRRKRTRRRRRRM